MSEGRLPPEPERTRPEGLISRLELAGLQLGNVRDDLERSEWMATAHSRAAHAQIRGALVQIRHAREALAEAKRSLTAGTVPVAEGLKKSSRRPTG